MVFFVVILGLPIKASAYEISGVDIKPRGSISEAYDDNITFVKDNAEEDFITNIGLGLDGKYEDKSKTLEFTGNINRQIFAENHKFDNTSEDFSLDFKKELSRYDRLNLIDAFTHAYEPVSLAEAFGRTTGRYSYYTNRFSLEYAKDITEPLTVSIRYGNDLDIFLREDLSDSYLNRAGVKADYSLSSATIFSFLYDYSNREFDPGNNATKNALSAGIRQYITKQLYLDTRAGIDFINSYNNADYTKPMIFASLTDEIDENTTAFLSFTKEYSTNPYTEDIFNNWQVSTYLTRELLKNLGCSISAFYGKGKYTSLNIREELMGGEVSLTYNLKKNLRLDLTYSYSKTNSTDDTREYAKNKISSRLTVGF